MSRSVWLNDRDVAYLSGNPDWREMPESEEHVKMRVTDTEYRRLLSNRMCAYMTEKGEPVCVGDLVSMLPGLYAAANQQYGRVAPGPHAHMPTPSERSEEQIMLSRQIAERKSEITMKEILSETKSAIEKIQTAPYPSSQAVEKRMEDDEEDGKLIRVYAGAFLNILYAEIYQHAFEEYRPHLTIGAMGAHVAAGLLSGATVYGQAPILVVWFSMLSNARFNPTETSLQQSYFGLASSRIEEAPENSRTKQRILAAAGLDEQQAADQVERTKRNHIRWFSQMMGPKSFGSILKRSISPMIAQPGAQTDVIRMIIEKSKNPSRFQNSMFIFDTSDLDEDKIRPAGLSREEGDVLHEIFKHGLSNITTPIGMFSVLVKGENILHFRTYKGNPLNEFYEIALQLRDMVSVFGIQSKNEMDSRLRKLPDGIVFEPIKKLFAEKMMELSASSTIGPYETSVSNFLLSQGYGHGNLDTSTFYQDQLIQGIAFICQTDPRMHKAVNAVFGLSPAGDVKDYRHHDKPMARRMQGALDRAKDVFARPIRALKAKYWNVSESEVPSTDGIETFNDILARLPVAGSPPRELTETRYLMAAGVYMQLLNGTLYGDSLTTMLGPDQEDQAKSMDDFASFVGNATITNILRYIISEKARRDYAVRYEVAWRYTRGAEEAHFWLLREESIENLTAMVKTMDAELKSISGETTTIVQMMGESRKIVSGIFGLLTIATFLLWHRAKKFVSKLLKHPMVESWLRRAGVWTEYNRVNEIVQAAAARDRQNATRPVPISTRTTGNVVFDANSDSESDSQQSPRSRVVSPDDSDYVPGRPQQPRVVSPDDHSDSVPRRPGPGVVFRSVSSDSE